MYYRLIGKTLVSYDLDTDEIHQKFHLDLVDFVAGPGIDMFLLDFEQMVDAKKELKAKLEIAEGDGKGGDAVRKATDFLLEFKDGGVLCFKAPNSKECLSWLLGITKLWMYSANDGIPEWIKVVN